MVIKTCLKIFVGRVQEHCQQCASDRSLDAFVHVIGLTSSIFLNMSKMVRTPSRGWFREFLHTSLSWRGDYNIADGNETCLNFLDW